ncbi:PKD domain-containing protein [Parachryseolinea silvisoli]|uniref:PKD domain-containing protein n=1 Tax=Parachryseolinea silvisoli TaxID=2873601 RepID=UPI002265AEA6|nr:PKD domain-containing protein [Parachryseolinea silvisoli]MCD9015736.1 PKD domain-containing protein [Parachryseolinea silvisoli]
MRITVVISICLLSFSVLGQHAVKQDTVKRESRIQPAGDDNKVKFSAITPPLQPIPGAPAPFYTFYWEFGDGAYSKEASPEHVYKKTGDYTVRLWTTNNYDNGKPPPSRPQKVPVKKITFNDTNPVQPVLPDGFDLKSNRAPVPGEEMVVIVRYQNDNDYPAHGKLYLFFNERKYKADNFQLTEVRTHHGETEVQDVVRVASRMDTNDPGALWASNKITLLPEADKKSDEGSLLQLSLALEAARAEYRTVHALEFNDMGARESRNVFYSLTTTPEMLKDTSAIITVKGIYVPDRGADNHKSKTLEMEIVTSHDPNKMSVSDTRLNYRFYKNKNIDFKIRFQNNGEGPAHSIKLQVAVPEAYDPHSLQVTDMYPVCPVCPDKQSTISCLDTTFSNNQILFHFKNIYLPGSNQKEEVDYDSTKGFVKYTLRFRESIAKSKTQSRTAIIFDKNDPILTNRATTRFKPGLSLGAKAGYVYYPTLKNSKGGFVGVTLSPFKSQHGYLQAELMVGIHTHSDSLYRADTASVDNGVASVFDVSQRNKFTSVQLYVVPISYRYTINSFIGVGTGVQLSVNLSEKTKEEAIHENYFVRQKENFREPRPDLNFNSTEETTASFTNLRPAVFADMTLGAARIGPTAGVRYAYYFTAPREQWQFYVLWKF